MAAAPSLDASGGDALAGLTAPSRAVVDQYLKWSRLSLNRFKRELDAEATAYRAGAVSSVQTYSGTDVARMLEGQVALLVGLAESQTTSAAAAAASLLKSVLREADRHRVPLEVDAAAVLGNTGGVAAMGEHGRKLLGGPGGRLAPLSLADANGEAARQLAEADAEILRLRRKLQEVTDAYTAVMAGRTGDTDRLLSMRDNVAEAERRAAELAARAQGQGGNLQQEVALLRQEVSEARRELSTRLNQSTQFQQVKKMLTQRNEQVKLLKHHLAQYNPQLAAQAGAGGGGDDIPPE